MQSLGWSTFTSAQNCTFYSIVFFIHSFNEWEICLDRLITGVCLSCGVRWYIPRLPKPLKTVGYFSFNISLFKTPSFKVHPCFNQTQIYAVRQSQYRVSLYRSHINPDIPFVPDGTTGSKLAWPRRHDWCPSICSQLWSSRFQWWFNL